MSKSKQNFDVKNGLNGNQTDHLLMATKGASEALWQLQALTKSIMNETADNETGQVYQLAKLGSFHAMDQAGVTDCMIEQLERGEV